MTEDPRWTPWSQLGPRQALTSTVSGYAEAAVLVALAGLVAWLAVGLTGESGAEEARIVGLVVLASSVVLAPLSRLSVGVSKEGVRYRRGTGRVRLIPGDQIIMAEAVRVGHGAILGLGIRPTWSTDRRIVRAGWALHLRLLSQEEVWLSTRGPLDPSSVLAIGGAAPCPSEGKGHSS